MAIKGPKGAEPTLRGWVNPKTGELLKSQRITQPQIDEWHGVDSFQEIQDINQHGKIEAAMAAAEITVDEDDVVTDNNQDGVIDELEKMSKKELEEFGRENGIELDRRFLKSKMIAQLKEHLGQ